MSATDDKFEIQTLTQRYADAVMRHDADDWGACWSVNGKWNLGPQAIEGREAIVTAWSGMMAGFPFAAFLVQPAMVEVDGDTAKSRTYVQETLQQADGTAFRVIGVYNDDCVREDGKWVFAERNYTVLYQGPVDLSGDVIGYPKD
jgi:hypothetical protein